MKFDYYLFDLDNSLLYIPNPGEYFDKVLVGTLKKMSCKGIPEKVVRGKFWFSGEDYINLLKEWGVQDVNDFWKYFDEIDYENRKILVDKKEIYFFRDVFSVLQELDNANKKMAIVSNAANYIVDFILDEFKMSHFFHEAFGLGFEKDIEIAKPSPKGIQRVLKNLDFNPNKSRAIMIGDSYLDVLAAKRANIDACLIKRDLDKYPDGYENWEHQPDYIIKNLDEIFKI